MISFKGSISGTVLTIASDSFNEKRIVPGMKIRNIWQASQPVGTITTYLDAGAAFPFFMPLEDLDGFEYQTISCRPRLRTTTDFEPTDAYPNGRYVERPLTSATFTKTTTHRMYTDQTARNPWFLQTTAGISGGAVYAWGNNLNDQCTIPAGATSNVTDVAVGLSHIIALKSNGSVIAWGDNSYGQCNVPGSIGTSAIAIVAGTNVNMALLNTGLLVTWGRDSYDVGVDTSGLATFKQSGASAGGNGSAATSYLESILPTKTIVKIFSGFRNFGAIDNTGKLYVWGCSILNKDGSSSALYNTISLGSIHALGILTNGDVVSWGQNVNGCCDIPSSLQGGVVSEVQAYSYIVKPDGLTGPEPRINPWPFGNTTVTTGNFEPELYAGFSTYIKTDHTILFTGWASTHLNSLFSGILVSKINISLNTIYNIPYDPGLTSRLSPYDIKGNWIFEPNNQIGYLESDLPPEGLHWLSSFINIEYVKYLQILNMDNLNTIAIAIEDRTVKPGQYLYFSDGFSFSDTITITSQLSGTTGQAGNYRIDAIGGLEVPEGTSFNAWLSGDTTAKMSMAPILFRWVGGNVGSQADPAQPEFKDFFRQKQLSSCQTYFEVISVPTVPPSTYAYATWRALAYRGTEETAFISGVPTDQTGQVVSTFTTDANGSGLLHNAPFGRHGVMWSSLSVGFQCDIVGIDLRLMAFNSIGKVLDTTRRYV